LGAQACRTILGGAKSQFRCNNNACADKRLADLSNAIANPPLGIMDEIGEDIGVE